MENAVMDFDTCYRTYYDRLYRVAYRIAGNREDAEDALQDAYVSAYRSRDSFRGDSALGTWLYRITVNSTLRYIRKRKSFPISQMAHAAGLTEVILPFRNKADLDDVPEEVREVMNFHPVSSVEEVIDLALEPAGNIADVASM